MSSACLPKRTAREIAEDQDDRPGADQFESVISDLPSLVLSVKSGAVSSSFGPGCSEPIS